MKKTVRSEDFAHRLVETRQKQKLQQKDVARSIGVTPVTMNRFEKGERTPDVMQMKDLVEIMPVDLNWLITGRVFKNAGANEEKPGVAGVVIFQGGVPKGEILVPGCKGAIDAFQVMGMSMAPRILENDYVLVDRETPSVGDLVAYRDEYFQEKVGWLRAAGGDGEQYLVPENPGYVRESEEKCFIKGRVVCSVRVNHYLR